MNNKFKLTVKGDDALDTLTKNWPIQSAIYSKSWVIQSLNIYNSLLDLVDQIEVMHANMNPNMAVEITIKHLQALLFLDMKKLETQKDIMEEREKHERNT